MTNEELKKLEDDLWDSANNPKFGAGSRKSAGQIVPAPDISSRAPAAPSRSRFGRARPGFIVLSQQIRLRRSHMYIEMNVRLKDSTPAGVECSLIM